MWSLQLEDRSSSIAFILIDPYQLPSAWDSLWQGPCRHTGFMHHGVSASLPATLWLGGCSQMRWLTQEVSVLEGPEVGPIFSHLWFVTCPRWEGPLLLWTLSLRDFRAHCVWAAYLEPGVIVASPMCPRELVMEQSQAWLSLDEEGSSRQDSTP